jgi:hypothetical protein
VAYPELGMRSRRGDSNSRPAVYETAESEINSSVARTELTHTLTHTGDVARS